jgi:hypothetical protein
MQKYAYFMPCGKISKRLKSLENTRFYEYDQSTFYLPRQHTEKNLKRPKNNGIEGTRFEISTFFTPLETRKPKRKTMPIEEAGNLKIPLF